MKKLLKPVNLPWMVLGAGALGLVLQLWLLGSEDRKGLLPPWHIAGILLWVLTLGVIGLLLWCSRTLIAGKKYNFNFPPSLPGAIGAVAAALGILITALPGLEEGGKVGLAYAVTGFVCVPVLLLLGLFRLKGIHPNLLFHGVICIHLALRLILQYQEWSAEPQLMTFLFPLLATVFLMLACYQRSAFDANAGKRRSYALLNLLTVYFSCLALAGKEDVLFYLAIIVWMQTDLCSLKRLRKRQPKSQEGA